MRQNGNLSHRHPQYAYARRTGRRYRYQKPRQFEINSSVIRNNETGEFLTYFPEFKSAAYDCKNKIDGIIAQLDGTALELWAKTFATQKDFASEEKDKFLCRYYFEWFRDNNLTACEWFWRLPDEKIVKISNWFKLPDAI